MTIPRVLHVSTEESHGGAARAASRIHQSLVEFGVDSRMRVLNGTGSDRRVTAGRRGGRLSRVAWRLQRRWLAFNERGWKTENPVLHTFGQVGAGLLRELNSSDVDVFNLHWISDMLSIRDVGRLRKPVIWTLHDMWPFCGGEHYAPDDASARFRHGYKADSRPAGEAGPDLNRLTWERKHDAWKRQLFTVICPSHWLAKCARESALFSDCAVHVVSYPLDVTGMWKELPLEAARLVLGLPLDRKLVLMGAYGGLADPRKGGDLLRETMRKVASRCSANVELVIYGQERPALGEDWQLPVHWLGDVRDDRILAMAYSASDLMVVPSRQDNLPNTAVEAQACGVPVVAFDIGGLPDIVTHRATGWLARPFDTDDLAQGVRWIVEDQDRWRSMRNAARIAAVDKFSPRKIAQQYVNIYEEAAKHVMAKSVPTRLIQAAGVGRTSSHLRD